MTPNLVCMILAMTLNLVCMILTMTPNLVCMILAITRSVVQVNYNYLVPFLNDSSSIDLYRAFFVRSVTLSPYTLYACFLQWLKEMCTRTLSLKWALSLYVQMTPFLAPCLEHIVVIINCMCVSLFEFPTYSELDIFGSSTVPGHLQN